MIRSHLRKRQSPQSPKQPMATAQQLAGGLPPLLLAAEHLLRQMQATHGGLHGRKRQGYGQSFWQFRPYVAGDPIRSIDWRQSAKSMRSFVRETEWEGRESVLFWLQNDPAMICPAGHTTQTKRDIGSVLIFALAMLLARGEENFGWLAEQGVALGQHGLQQFWQGWQSATTPTSLPPSHPLKPAQAGSTLVLLGDFWAPPSSWQVLLSQWQAQCCSGLLVRLIHPDELYFPFEQSSQFRTPDQQLSVTLGQPSQLRSKYLKALQEHTAAMQLLAAQHGFTWVDLPTDQPLPSMLSRLLRLLEQKR